MLRHAPLAVLIALAACARPLPPPVADMPAGAEVFRTLDGQSFATEAERSAYLRGTDAARQERALIALERRRQAEATADLGALQADRRRLARQADADRTAEAGRTAAEAVAAAARRAERQARRDLARAGTPTEREAARQALARAERTTERAERRADRLTPGAAIAGAGSGRLPGDDLGPSSARPAPWQRLSRYRRAGEPLPDFRRRVVDAIARARRDGGQVGDYLAE